MQALANICTTRNCTTVFPPDVESYSLQDDSIFSPQLSFIVNCPAGYQCPPGSFPKTVTYPAGNWTVPTPVPNPGFPIIITMVGCQSTVTQQLPSGSSTAAIYQATQDVISEIARQQAECDSVTGLNPTSSYVNSEQSKTITCDDGYELQFTGTLPYYISISGDTVSIAAGLFAGSSQSEANNFAWGTLNDWIDAATLAGTLTCATCTITTSSPLPDGDVGSPYSETLTVTGLTGTPVWSVTVGSLPAGLSLNASTGEISGTPTLEETQNFTVQVTNGTRICSKEFSIQTIAAFNCLGNASAVQDLIWVQDPSMPAPPCAVQSIVGGSGAWSTTRTTAGACNISPGAIDISSVLCNPGPAYLLTVTFAFASTGNILLFPPSGPFNTSFSLYFDGVSVANQTADLLTDTPNPVVLSAMLPANSITTIRLYFATTGGVIPAAPANYITIASTSDMTITPLIPP